MMADAWRLKGKISNLVRKGSSWIETLHHSRCSFDCPWKQLTNLKAKEQLNWLVFVEILLSLDSWIMNRLTLELRFAWWKAFGMRRRKKNVVRSIIYPRSLFLLFERVSVNALARISRPLGSEMNRILSLVLVLEMIHRQNHHSYRSFSLLTYSAFLRETVPRRWCDKFLVESAWQK